MSCPNCINVTPAEKKAYGGCETCWASRQWLSRGTPNTVRTDKRVADAPRPRGKKR